MDEKLIIRFAEPGDAKEILKFIKELAEYEESVTLVTATEADILQSLFIKKQAEVLIAESGGTPVAFALFFHNYSTFLGKANLYLEDLYVREKYRGAGAGKLLLGSLARLAVERGCERLDWLCLDENYKRPSFIRNSARK